MTRSSHKVQSQTSSLTLVLRSHQVRPSWKLAMAKPSFPFRLDQLPKSLPLVLCFGAPPRPFPTLAMLMVAHQRPTIAPSVGWTLINPLRCLLQAMTSISPTMDRWVPIHQNAADRSDPGSLSGSYSLRQSTTRPLTPLPFLDAVAVTRRKVVPRSCQSSWEARMAKLDT